MTRPACCVDLGVTDYAAVLTAMQTFTDTRAADTPDEIWITEHQPVFTQGQAGKTEHVLAPGSIAVVQTDRGGQVTYHGPGQIVAYLLFDLRRCGLTVRGLVSGIEDAVVRTLARYNIAGVSRPDAPGVYVDGAKVSALGLRVRRGCSYHGLSLNVNMDLEPYSRINPCGYRNLDVVQVADLGGPSDLEEVKADLLEALAQVYDLDVRSRGRLDFSTA